MDEDVANLVLPGLEVPKPQKLAILSAWGRREKKWILANAPKKN